jgi:hypothetical protein
VSSNIDGTIQRGFPVQAFIIGIAVALGTFVLTRVVGMDRDKALYPTILMVVER